MRNEYGVNNKSGGKDKIKSLSSFFAFLKKRTQADYITFNVKKIFNHLKIVFIQAASFYYFDLERHICIKTNVFNYIIGKV